MLLEWQFWGQTYAHGNCGETIWSLYWFTYLMIVYEDRDLPHISGSILLFANLIGTRKREFSKVFKFYIQTIAFCIQISQLEYIMKEKNFIYKEEFKKIKYLGINFKSSRIYKKKNK